MTRYYLLLSCSCIDESSTINGVVQTNTPREVRAKINVVTGISMSVWRGSRCPTSISCGNVGYQSRDSWYMSWRQTRGTLPSRSKLVAVAHLAQAIISAMIGRRSPDAWSVRTTGRSPAYRDWSLVSKAHPIVQPARIPMRYASSDEPPTETGLAVGWLNCLN